MGIKLDPNKALDVLAKQAAPGIMRGVVLEFLKDMTPSQVYDIAVLNKDANIWENLPPDWKAKLAGLHNKVGLIDILTIDWLVETLRPTRPDLASLILNSKEVRAFLRKLTKEMHNGVSRELASSQ